MAPTISADTKKITVKKGCSGGKLMKIRAPEAGTERREEFGDVYFLFLVGFPWLSYILCERIINTSDHLRSS